MPVELYALLLLSLRILSVALLLNVINKQIKLKKRPIKDARAGVLRRDMYFLTLIALSMNIIPIIVDIFSLMGMGTRPDSISWLSVGYVFSYSFGTLSLTGVIYRMYRKSLDY